MRKRLIELIKRDNCRDPFNCSSQCKYIESDDCHSERLADLILADGWIRLPCKVGDTVYRISGNYFGEKIFEGVVAQISIYNNGEIRFWEHGHPLSFTPNDFGETVFLTREEAEQKLKEVKG